MQSRIAPILIRWYERHGRRLPWRETRDPYRIWLSEVILQQTRVQQGWSYYEQFTTHYPTIQSLAAASEDEVLKLWQGLGYYSRARNLHAAARQVVEHFDGRFPDTYEAIRSLRGVGDYTAAAIASMAYDLPHAVVDGNVYRVLARLFDIETPIDSTEGRKGFATLAEELLDKAHPATYNQAIMDFGAVQCTPQHPDCTACPLADCCLAHSAGTVLQRPIKQGHTKVRDRYFNYLHLTDGHATLLHRRTAGDIWQGLYEFPLIETPSEVDFITLSRTEAFTQLLGGQPFQLTASQRMPQHLLSHQRLHATFHRVQVEALPHHSDLIAIPTERLDDYAVSRLTDRYLAHE
ncbi:MAG: A/G-specific adenine glycosylase [Alistipes sp.]|nr:A/G-specific adenine glycosylase [Alistipes sp.]